MAEDNIENDQETTKSTKEKTEDIVNEEVKQDEAPADQVKPPKITPELLDQIKNQIEFYFGDVNLQRDKFLKEQMALDEGWIPMSVMLNFKMLASLTTDVDVILESLKDSDLMEISEDKKKIRRSPKYPLPEYNDEYRKAQQERTVYVKGFPQKDMTIMKLKTFLKPYEPIENIIMRKYKSGENEMIFKGSIFIQFKTLESAKSFMDLESIKYEETELIRMWSKDHAEEAAKEKEEKRQKRDKRKGTETNGNKTVDDEEKDDQKKDEIPKGSLIFLSGLGTECTREDIRKEFLELDACVAFIDYFKGNPEAWVRLQGENAAQAIVDKMENNKIMLKDNEVTCRILEGDEESKYLEKVKSALKSLREERGKKNKFGGRKDRGKKRKQSPEQERSANKKTKN